nr:LacI family DNA-binding transcriptional regulator [Sphingomonas baiyangensis]
MMVRRPSVTIKHVAADAGVSLQTVSRVINKEPNVRPQMAERVQASIDRLGYVPSISAQRMRGSRSYLILALNDRERTLADWRERQGADWVDQMMLGGMSKCAEHGYRLIVELVDTHSDHVERELSAALAALRPDGVILTPPHSENPVILAMLEAAHIRVARIGSLKPGPGFALTMDDERAAGLATDHLIELGHRAIGFIAGPAAYELSQWRIKGWQHAMQAAGLATDSFARGDFGYESGIAAAEALLDGPLMPSAIIASSDRMALATLEVARRRDLRVPEDLSVISFDDTPIVRFTHPPLTAVVQPIAEVSARAVERIIAGDGSDGEADRQPEAIPASLAVRSSTAPPRRA